MALCTGVLCTGCDVGTAKTRANSNCSKSLARLENTIEPMAEKVDDMHNKLNGDLNVKISEMHHLMLSLSSMEASPQTWPSGSDACLSPGPSPFLEPKKSRMVSVPLPNMKPMREASTPYKLRTPEDTPELVGSEYVPRSEQVRSMSSTSSRDSYLDRRESGLIPVEYQYSIRSFHDSPPPQYEQRNRGVSGHSPLGSRLEDNNAARRPSEWSNESMSPIQSMLPPPAISPEHDAPMLHTESYSIMPALATAPPPAKLKRTNITASQQALFERFIFDDSVCLCEV